MRADRLSEGDPASESPQARPLTVTVTGEQPVTQDPDERTHVEALVSSRPASSEPASDTHRRSPARDLPAVGSSIKHYEIIRKLGEGGMGIVFLARDIKLGRLVAIKLLVEYSGDRAQRFLAEAQVTARCIHENIVVVHEVDELGGHPYMVLEYVEGRTLRALMDQRRRASLSEPPSGDTARAEVSFALEMIIPVVRALVCAHQLGVVHRDLKPENILLADAGPIKVLDFGIARQLKVEDAPGLEDTRRRGAEATPIRPEARSGTLPYMSPEQIRAEEIDPRSDLWAVGIMLHELVAGRHPLAPLEPGWRRRVVDPHEPMPSLREARPDLGAIAGVIDRCLTKQITGRFASAKDLLAELERIAGDLRAQALSGDERPFVGLSAFQEPDAARFFGRDHDVAGILGRLRSQELVVVTGPSGAGKSSFVRAGLIPALKRSGTPWETFVVRPGRAPLAALADVLEQVIEGDRGDLVEALRAEPGLLGARLRERCRTRGRGRILLFVDQFEELYTLDTGAGERAAFLASLEGVADDASSPLRVVLSVRSDFLEPMSHDRRFMARAMSGIWFLPPMGRDQLREALERSVEVAGHHFEDDAMVEEMLDTLEGTRCPLPLLQFTATKLWEARDRGQRRFTRESYRALGGVAGALSSQANAVLAGLTAQDQRLARAIFLRLVTPERTRAIVRVAELCDLDEDGGAISRVVHHLAGARLLLTEGSGERDGATVELSHESLIEQWPKLRRWLEEDEQDAALISRLRTAAQQWESSGEAEGLLWRDRAAEEAARFRERRRADPGGAARSPLGKREERYLLAVVALLEGGRRRRRRLVLGVITALAVIAGAVSTLAIIAARSADRAQAEAVQARNATRMATARQMQSDPTTVLALMREIEPPNLPRGSSDLARWALDTGVSAVVIPGLGGVNHAAFSPDGTRIVAASADKAVRIWRADGTGEPLVLPQDDVATCAEFSPDGKHIVTTDTGLTARIWNADGTGEPILLRGHEGFVLSAAFSPDGKRVVTSSGDKTARVWNADGTGEPIILRGSETLVWSVDFSPDGKRVAGGAKDGTVRVWNADGTGEPIVFHHDGFAVLGLAFSPDGRRIATACRDKLVRVWNADGTGEPIVLRGHDDWVWSARWSPDGEHIVTASFDKTARIWSLDAEKEPLILHGHQDTVTFAAYSRDGKHVVTSSLDKTVRRWDLDDIRPPLVVRRRDAPVYSVAYSPDGRSIVAGSTDKTARIWSAQTGEERAVLRGHEGWVRKASYSPDGRSIVTASTDGTARIWSADGKGEPVVLRTQQGEVSSAMYSPDGRSIATASFDTTVHVHRSDGTGEPLVLRGHSMPVICTAFSPDSRRIVSAGFDTTLRIWNADGAGEAIVLRGHQDQIKSVAYSPDGQFIASASDDSTVRVWRSDGTKEPIAILEHGAQVNWVAYSSDGRRVVTASDDKAVRIWNADGTGTPMVLRGPELAVKAAVWTPDGKGIAAAFADGTVWIWAELRSTGSVDAPELWTATSYCMPIERRMQLLDASSATAHAARERCLSRVAEASAAHAAR